LDPLVSCPHISSFPSENLQLIKLKAGTTVVTDITGLQTNLVAIVDAIRASAQEITPVVNAPAAKLNTAEVHSLLADLESVQSMATSIKTTLDKATGGFSSGMHLFHVHL
jgi:hypothetical protein